MTVTGLTAKRSLIFAARSLCSYGNTFKEARRTGDQFAYEYHACRDGMADEKTNVPEPQNGFFYDELPLLVRTIDFKKPSGDSEIRLAPFVIKSKKDNVVFEFAHVRLGPAKNFLPVSVQQSAEQEKFTLDRDFPHLLREWIAADGSHLQLKRSLKIDYWHYGKNGDRERALTDPMLQHPD